MRAPCGRAAHFNRRRVLKLAAAGATLLSAPVFPRPAAAGHADALLLSCMDYRLLDDIVRYMDGRELTDNYDQVILAGASLGATTNVYPSWGETFWSHLQLALDLHHVNKLIVLDHRDCGAYKAIFGQDYAADPQRETEIHALQMKELNALVAEKHPTLPTELLLMSLDGSVETIS
ncbi:MAG: hypothetical protein JNM75_11175 [Rhodospirillales bacterium]|nr:hypothetical protein [Rhodospirillales bacterium]